MKPDVTKPDVARAEYRSRVGNRVPPEHAMTPAGGVVCGRHSVALALVDGYRPAVYFGISYPLGKRPFQFFILPAEARALAALLVAAAEKIEGGK